MMLLLFWWFFAYFSWASDSPLRGTAAPLGIVIGHFLMKNLSLLCVFSLVVVYYITAIKG